MAKMASGPKSENRRTKNRKKSERPKTEKTYSKIAGSAYKVNEPDRWTCTRMT